MRIGVLTITACLMTHDNEPPNAFLFAASAVEDFLEQVTAKPRRHHTRLNVVGQPPLQPGRRHR